jgi:diguanylate cyclase (GGDEF)-like protein
VIHRSNKPRPWAPKKQFIWWVITASLALHLIIYILGITLFKSWRYEHLPLHSVIEAVGSVIALLVAYKLFSLNAHGIGPKHGIRIAQALIVMGLLDGFHSLTHAGNNFVWLHSLATFLGGLCFMFIFLPARQKNTMQHTFIIVLATISIGVLSLLVPNLSPVMVEEGSFTLTANILNLLGGVFLILTATFLVVEYHRTASTDDLLFSLHCLLFGLAALMFQSSILWDASWWGWHILRLMAYFAALVFVLLSEKKLYSQIDRFSYRMNQLAYTDTLTQVSNRRHFNHVFQHEFERARRYEHPLTVVMLDIDHFKTLNDTFGHDAGDKVLKRLALHVKSHLRENDFFARYGGEEFVFILPSTTKQDAFNLIERVRISIESLVIDISEGKQVNVTASFGIADFVSDDESEQTLFKRADEALYIAKRTGRNQTIIFEALAL